MTKKLFAAGNQKPLIVLVLVVILGIGAILFASNVDPNDIQPKADVNNLPVEREQAPELDASLGWLNTDGYSAEDLKGKVVMYDFWTYSCINCQRTFPYLRALWDRYEDDGLVLIGIHSPEFDFEKVDKNIEKATKKYGVTWPVVFDDNMVNWSNFENQYWPAKYIADKKGRIRYHHYGEGRYDETEDVIRKLLGIKESAARANLPGEKTQDITQPITPEIYINPVRGQLNAPNGKSVVTQEQEPSQDQVTLFGSVDVQEERSILVEAGAKLTVNYSAAEVNIVAEPLSELRTGELEVTMDGKPVPESVRGKDLSVDASGNTFLTVSSSDLLHVIQSDDIQQHILVLKARTSNIALYAFTFGG